MKPTVREMSPSRLAGRCRDMQPNGSHEPFCLELFRRAIVETCSLSWHYLHNQYYSLVRYWVSRRISTDADTIEDLTQEAFTAFWRFYTADKLDQAEELGAILAYMKSCAASAVAQAHRREDRRVPTVEWDQYVVDAQASVQSSEASSVQEMTAQRIWSIIEARCKNEREHIVARSTFLAGLMPRHIADKLPNLFPEVSEVYRVKRNLLARLRRDPLLQSIRKNEPSEHLNQ